MIEWSYDILWMILYTQFVSVFFVNNLSWFLHDGVKLYFISIKYKKSSMKFLFILILLKVYAYLNVFNLQSRASF